MEHDQIQAASVAANQEWFATQTDGEFVEGSPHLKHPVLRGYCLQLAREAMQLGARGLLQPSVLDMGAGDGMLTIPFLEMGASVTAADASSELLERLASRVGGHREHLILSPGDIFATLEEFRRSGRQFELVSASSFLHHIPDYLQLCRAAADVIRPGGVLFSFQDPLRYNSLDRATYCLDRFSYFAWRVFQGNYGRGLRTRGRRLLGSYREDLPEDTAEYHVVREGVDQDAIRRVLEESGFHCEIRRYWSTQSTFFQQVGTKLGRLNNFAVIARKQIA